MSTAVESVPRAESRWLFGPAPDLAFGCGLLYAVFFVAQAVDGAALEARLPLALLPFLTLALGAPHYGATLLRVYEKRADRERYFNFAAVVSVIVAVAFAVGLSVPIVGSSILTLYLTWSPWHYTAQNYGVAATLFRRRCPDVGGAILRPLRAAFTLSYALVFLSLHGPNGGTQQAIAGYEGSIYSFLSLGIPTELRDPAMWGVIVAQLTATALALGAVVRAGVARAAIPVILLLATQAVWFLLPAAVPVWPALARIAPFAPEHRAYAFMWVAVGHFLQYLWITGYSATADGHRSRRFAFLGKALLVGISIWTLPALLFAPGLLGRLPYDLGLGLLAAASVNLHHFLLDGAIWHLRDDRIAKLLLGPRGLRTDRDDPAAASSPRRRVVVAVAWLIGAAVLVVAALGSWESLVGNAAAERGDFERYALAAKRRAWIGRDGPEPRFQLGVHALQAGDLEAAQRELEAGLRLHPTAELHRLDGELALLLGEPDRALAAYERALALDPDSAPAHYQVARILVEKQRIEEALAHLVRANEIWPDTPPISTLLEELRAARGEAESRAGAD